jgi:hypothetical protein
VASAVSRRKITKAELLAVAAGHIVGTGELVASFEK